MPEVPPPMRVASSTVTAAPACASRYATEAPITPAPITIVLIICVSSGSKWIMARDHPAIARGHRDRLDGPALRPAQRDRGCEKQRPGGTCTARRLAAQHQARWLRVGVG